MGNEKKFIKRVICTLIKPYIVRYKGDFKLILLLIFLLTFFIILLITLD